MWRPRLVPPLSRWRSLATGIGRLFDRAARRASSSALRRFTLAQCAAALALAALTFALLVTRKFSLSPGTPALESSRVEAFDAGATPDVTGATGSGQGSQGPAQTR